MRPVKNNTKELLRIRIIGNWYNTGVMDVCFKCGMTLDGNTFMCDGCWANAPQKVKDRLQVLRGNWRIDDIVVKLSEYSAILLGPDGSIKYETSQE